MVSTFFFVFYVSKDKNDCAGYKYVVEQNGSILSHSRSTHDLIVKVEKGIKIYFCRVYFLPLGTIAFCLLSYSFFMALTPHFFLHRNKSRQTHVVRGA